MANHNKEIKKSSVHRCPICSNDCKRQSQAVREGVKSMRSLLEKHNKLKGGFAGLKVKLIVTKEESEKIRKHSSKKHLHYEFLQKRIVKLHGHETFINLMKHIDNPIPFNEMEYRKHYGLKK